MCGRRLKGSLEKGQGLQSGRDGCRTRSPPEAGQRAGGSEHRELVVNGQMQPSP